VEVRGNQRRMEVSGWRLGVRTRATAIAHARLEAPILGRRRAQNDTRGKSFTACNFSASVGGRKMTPRYILVVILAHACLCWSCLIIRYLPRTTYLLCLVFFCTNNKYMCSSLRRGLDVGLSCLTLNLPHTLVIM
jgi:hypothetical protein